MKRAIIQYLIAALLAGCSGVGAADDLRLNVGGEYTSGKYGGTEKTEIRYFPVTGSYVTGLWLLKLTVPYLQISGPANIIGVDCSAMQIPMAQSAQNSARRTVSGLGDVIAAASYAVHENRAAGFFFDLTGKIKFGTADKDRNLGTGKNDYSIQGGISKRTNNWTLFSDLGWRKMGNPSGITFENPRYGSVGASYGVSNSATAGMAYDYRARIVDGGANVRELTAFVVLGLGKAAKIQGYISKGFSDASPDRGAGLTWSSGF